MSKNVRQNRRREAKVSEIDRQGWKSLIGVILKIALTCVLALGIPYGLYMYYQHLVDMEYFKPAQFKVHGNLRMDDESIKDASGLLNEGANLFEADIHVIETGIETLPWVKKAKVTIDLPDSVDIEIEEHQPLGIVNDGQLSVVDEDGNSIKYWTAEDTLMSPIVSLDKALDVRTHEIVRAFELADLVAQKGYPHKVQEIHYDMATGYTLYTDISEIRLGYDRFDERVDRLIEIDNLLNSRSVTADYILIDGDSLDQVVVKPKPKVVVVAAEQKKAESTADASPETSPENRR